MDMAQRHLFRSAESRAIRRKRAKCVGRAATIRRLVAELDDVTRERAEMIRGGIHWWHAMRAVAGTLGLKSLADVLPGVEKLLAERSRLRKRMAARLRKLRAESSYHRSLAFKWHMAQRIHDGLIAVLAREKRLEIASNRRIDELQSELGRLRAMLVEWHVARASMSATPPIPVQEWSGAWDKTRDAYDAIEAEARRLWEEQHHD